MVDSTQPITTSTVSTQTVSALVIALSVIRGPFFKDGKHFFYLATDAVRNLDVTTGEIVDNTFSLYMTDDASNSKYHEAKAYLEEHGTISYERKHS